MAQTWNGMSAAERDAAWAAAVRRSVGAERMAARAGTAAAQAVEPVTVVRAIGAPGARVYEVRKPVPMPVAAAQAGASAEAMSGPKPTPMPMPTATKQPAPQPMRRVGGMAAGHRKVRELGRNKAGDCYVREAVVDAAGRWRVITLQVSLRGESLLAAHGIEVGQRIPDRLFRELRARGWLFTRSAR